MNKLKYWRSVRMFEVRELAQKAGVSPTTVSRIENDRIKGQALTLAKLANALDVDLTEFADLINDPKDLPVVLTKHDIGRSPNIPDMVAAMLGTILL